MQLFCKNQKCLNIWDYSGKKKKDKDRVTCPKCHYRILLSNAKKNNSVEKISSLENSNNFKNLKIVQKEKITQTQDSPEISSFQEAKKESNNGAKKTNLSKNFHLNPEDNFPAAEKKLSSLVEIKELPGGLRAKGYEE